ncbi:hypothetical protein OJAV_G00169530 [Oryzias javanicus]|uniref:Uncharacterized protein n=1 Tax=Oryzias javanicus TaxID=123683 RepID=A0A437CEM7_ORYJA|nr:hypothetical protein OJAV_G00169530 [Oryzias javanicus]
MEIFGNQGSPFHGADAPQLHVCKEEEERNYNCVQEEQESPQIKEEEEELCCSQEEKQLLLKQEVKSECEEIFVIQFEDLSEKHICKEETESEQLLWKQERSSSPNEEEPELPQIKEEREENVSPTLNKSQRERVQLVLNQEADENLEFQTDKLDHHHPQRNIIRIPIVTLQSTDLSHNHIYEEQTDAEQLLRKQERSSSPDEEEPELPEIKEERASKENRINAYTSSRNEYMMNGSSDQERMSNLDQAEPEPKPPQIKEEPEELCINHEGVQLVVNQETNVKVEEINSNCEEICQLYQNSKSELKELLDNQHNLRNIIRIPVEKVQGIDLSQNHIYKGQTDTEQLLWKQERSSSPDEEKPEIPEIKGEWEESREYRMNGSSRQEEVSTLDQAEPDPTQFKEEPNELCINQEKESPLLNQDADVNVELKSEYGHNFGNRKKILFQFKELSHYHYGQRIRNAETELHKTDVQKQHLFEDEDKLHIHKQELHTILDQAEPEPPQIKEEPEELCSNQEGEQLLLNQEADVKVEVKSDLLDHQHQSRSIIMIPVIKLERIDLSEKHIYKEEIEDEQLHGKQERSSSLDEEKPELPEIKEEWEEVYITEEDELELKQENDDFMVTGYDQERMDSEPEPTGLSFIFSPEAELSCHMSVIFL